MHSTNTSYEHQKKYASYLFAVKYHDEHRAHFWEKKGPVHLNTLVNAAIIHITGPSVQHQLLLYT